MTAPLSRHIQQLWPHLYVLPVRGINCSLCVMTADWCTVSCSNLVLFRSLVGVSSVSMWLSVWSHSCPASSQTDNSSTYSQPSKQVLQLCVDLLLDLSNTISVMTAVARKHTPLSTCIVIWYFVSYVWFCLRRKITLNRCCILFMYCKSEED